MRMARLKVVFRDEITNMTIKEQSGEIIDAPTNIALSIQGKSVNVYLMGRKGHYRLDMPLDEAIEELDAAMRDDGRLVIVLQEPARDLYGEGTFSTPR